MYQQSDTQFLSVMMTFRLISVLVTACSVVHSHGVERDALLVIGGYYHSGGNDHYHRSAELIGAESSCSPDLVPTLPEPRSGIAVARLTNGILACGGFYLHVRTECYIYSPERGQWSLETRLPLAEGLFFASAAAVGDDYYLAGGRWFNRSISKWEYSDKVWRYELSSGRWYPLPSLESPTADACMVSLPTGHIALIGGSKDEYRYIDEPSRVNILQVRDSLAADHHNHIDDLRWQSDLLPPLLASRMWHACAVGKIGNELGIVVAGGYYNGATSMFLPLSNRISSRIDSANRPNWRWLASLPDDRKWGPALGFVGLRTGVEPQTMVMAGGKDYGDNTVDVHTSVITNSALVDARTGQSEDDGPPRGTWYLSGKVSMAFKREFSSYVTVPLTWFPRCRNV